MFSINSVRVESLNYGPGHEHRGYDKQRRPTGYIFPEYFLVFSPESAGRQGASAQSPRPVMHGGARPRFALGRSSVERRDGSQRSELCHSRSFDPDRRSGRIHKQGPPFSAAISGAMTVGRHNGAVAKIRINAIVTSSHLDGTGRPARRLSFVDCSTTRNLRVRGMLGR